MKIKFIIPIMFICFAGENISAEEKLTKSDAHEFIGSWIKKGAVEYPPDNKIYDYFGSDCISKFSINYSSRPPRNIVSVINWTEITEIVRSPNRFYIGFRGRTNFPDDREYTLLLASENLGDRLFKAFSLLQKQCDTSGAKF